MKIIVYKYNKIICKFIRGIDSIVNVVFYFNWLWLVFCRFDSDDSEIEVVRVDNSCT